MREDLRTGVSEKRRNPSQKGESGSHGTRGGGGFSPKETSLIFKGGEKKRVKFGSDKRE